MNDSLAQVIECQTTRDLVHQTSQIAHSLPAELRGRFRFAVGELLLEDFTHAHRYAHGKTVAELLAAACVETEEHWANESLSDYPSWEWASFASHQGSLPVLLGDFVNKLVEGDVEVRKKTRDFFGQWPIESADIVGQLGAVPLFLRLLLHLIVADREDVERDIRLHKSLISNLVDYESNTRYFEGNPEAFRSSIIREAANARGVLLTCLMHSHSAVRAEALRAFRAWQSVDELAPLCHGAPTGVITQIIEDDIDSACVVEGIRFVMREEDASLPDLTLHHNSSDFRRQIAAAWAAFMVDGVNAHAAKLAFVCKCSLCMDYPIPGLNEQLEAMGPQAKREAVRLARECMASLGVVGTIATIDQLVLSTPTFCVQERCCAYRHILDRLHGLQGSDEFERLKRPTMDLIAADDVVWATDRKRLNLRRWLKRAGLPDDRQSLVDRQE